MGTKRSANSCRLACMSKLGGKLRIAGVIPARLASTRLSRKVLREIAGKPMVEWVWRAAAESGWMDPVVVATDSDEVAAVCKARGIPVEMTSPSCASGSDRVREVAGRIAADVYVNIQGDEPTLTSEFFPPLLTLFDRAGGGSYDAGGGVPAGGSGQSKCGEGGDGTGRAGSLLFAGHDSVRSRRCGIHGLSKASGNLRVSQSGPGSIWRSGADSAGEAGAAGAVAAAGKWNQYLRGCGSCGHDRCGYRGRFAESRGDSESETRRAIRAISSRNSEI